MSGIKARLVMLEIRNDDLIFLRQSPRHCTLIRIMRGQFKDLENTL